MVLTKQQIEDVEAIFQRVFKREQQDIIHQIQAHFDAKVEHLINKYETEIKRLETKVQEQQKNIEKLEQKAINAEQYSRRNLVRIFGISEEEQEDVQETVVSVIEKHLKIQISPDVIDNIHRTGVKSVNKPRPIILKFTSYRFKQQIMLKRNLFKGTGITVQDDLTRERLELLIKAKNKYGARNAWTIRGNVMANTDTGKRCIRTEQDLF